MRLPSIDFAVDFRHPCQKAEEPAKEHILPVLDTFANAVVLHNASLSAASLLCLAVTHSSDYLSESHSRPAPALMDVRDAIDAFSLVADDKRILWRVGREKAGEARDVSVKVVLIGIWFHPLHR